MMDYFKLKELLPIIIPSEKIYTLYVPAAKYSATSQYTLTVCSSPLYSMYFLIEYCN